MLELDPTADAIVWEWCAWDHLLPVGERAVDRPERIDPGAAAASMREDWLHMNSVHYEPVRDEILLSVHNTSELWIVDHGGSTEETRGARGDLLYRWGNPRMHGAAGAQVLVAQHDAEWIGDATVLVFDNGDMRLRPSSRVLELTLPAGMDPPYLREGDAYGPTAPSWEYAPTGTDAFFAENVSGAQRLRSGNTLITDGPHGLVREVTRAGERVWDWAIATSAGMPATVFRVERYEADDPALTGRDLTPTGPVEIELDAPR